MPIYRLHDHLATVLYWIDGDTVKVMFDLDFCIYTRVSVRLLGLDTPEAGDEPGYALAKNRAIQLAPPGSLVIVTTEKAPGQSFTRYLGNVVPFGRGDGRTISQILLAEGLQKK